MRIRWIVGVSIACINLLPGVLSAQDRWPTPDYWNCTNRIGGSWTFGRAPSACDASSFGEDDVVWSKYGTLVYHDTKQAGSELPRYLDDTHAVIRDAASHYIRRRKPRVSPIEVVVFRRALLALAHQESFWTHYRLATDQRLKMMRGDFGHGHGMMQIDDRFHFVRIENGDAWDLVGNLTYSLDIYYAEWERAAKASCLSRADDYEARARAAYSAYNGGPAQLCRWTDPNHRWARNDVGFYQKFHAQAWIPHIANPQKPPPFNVGCEIDGGAQCLVPGVGKITAPFRAFVQKREIGICVDSSTGPECVSQARDLACLTGRSEPGEMQELGADRDVDDLNPRKLDRHELCAKPETEMLAVASWLQTATSINLRATAGGGKLGVVRSGELAQVLDFEIRADSTMTRYYRVRTASGAIGWIFAGGFADQDRYVSAVADRAGGLIPTFRARIAAGSGINVRETPGGEKIGMTAKNSVVNVHDVVVRGNANEVYLEISTNDGQRGFIYAGRTVPEPTVGFWVRPEGGP